MTTHPRLIVAVGLAVLISACGAAETAPTEVGGATPSSTATSSPTTTTTTPLTSDEAADPEAIESYLVAITNLLGDLGDAGPAFEEAFNEAAEEPETEEELVEQGKAYWGGTFGLQLDYNGAVAASDPPAGFTNAHDEYVATHRAFYQGLVDHINGFDTVADYDDFLNSVFDPSIGMPAELAALEAAYVSACKNLERLGRESGFDFNLECPEPPPEVVAVDVEVGGPWHADPNPIGVSNALAEMVITNVGDEPIEVVVVEVFEGDQANLPVIDGRVDLTLSGVSDPSSGFASFGIRYPDVHGPDGDSNVSIPPPALAPGDSVTLDPFELSGTVVIFDYRAGEYEAGSFVVIEES